MMLRGLVCLALVSGGLPAAGEDGRFALMVNDVSAVDEPWPLVGGLPFPKGALKDAAAVRITCDGREVAAQVDVAATWRDGSLRWALAGFTGKPRAQYQVEYGPGVSRSVPAAALRFQRKTDGRLTGDTGVASYEFLPDRFLPEHVRLSSAVVLAESGAGA